MTDSSREILVVLYGRENCHLCDEAEAALRRLSARVPIVIRHVDVDTDPALTEAYGTRLPVVTSEDGYVLSEGRVSVAELLTSLRKHAQAR